MKATIFDKKNCMYIDGKIFPWNAFEEEAEK